MNLKVSVSDNTSLSEFISTSDFSNENVKFFNCSFPN